MGLWKAFIRKIPVETVKNNLNVRLLELRLNIESVTPESLICVDNFLLALCPDQLILIVGIQFGFPLAEIRHHLLTLTVFCVIVCVVVVLTE